MRPKGHDSEWFSFVVMAAVLCLQDKGGDTTEKFGDRKIWRMRPSAINLSVTKSSGLLLPPLLPECPILTGVSATRLLNPEEIIQHA